MPLEQRNETSRTTSRRIKGRKMQTTQKADVCLKALLVPWGCFVSSNKWFDLYLKLILMPPSQTTHKKSQQARLVIPNLFAPQARWVMQGPAAGTWGWCREGLIQLQGGAQSDPSLATQGGGRVQRVAQPSPDPDMGRCGRDREQPSLIWTERQWAQTWSHYTAMA